MRPPTPITAGSGPASSQRGLSERRGGAGLALPLSKPRISTASAHSWIKHVLEEALQIKSKTLGWPTPKQHPGKPRISSPASPGLVKTLRQRWKLSLPAPMTQQGALLPSSARLPGG